MSERLLIPDDLAEMPPGPELAAVLAGIDRSRVNGHDMVIVLQARARQVAHDQAQLLADMMDVAHCPPGGPDSPAERTRDFVPYADDEIRAALCWTRRAAGEQLSLAAALVDRLPQVHQALTAGEIDLPRARVICDGLAVLADDEAARAAATEVLPIAGGLTTGQLRARLARLVITIDPQAAAARRDNSVADRRVESGLHPEGTAFLCGYQLPAERAAAALARVDALARAARRAGDDRSLDQLRADTLLDLLQGITPATAEQASSRGGVEVTVPLATLMGLAEHPGELAGWGPVLADIARQVAGRQRGRWRFTVYDGPELVATGVMRRRPTAEVIDFVRARDRVCRAPGCRVPAHRADLDHTRDWANGGPTSQENLATLCRHDHGGKHRGGWRYRQVAPGVFQWISPLGHTYVVPPEPRGP